MSGAGPIQTRTVRFALAADTVVDEGDGTELVVPEGWTLLKPGDAGLTRRVKASGPSWTVVERRGRKTFTYGVYAPAETVERERAALEVERSSPSTRRTPPSPTSWPTRSPATPRRSAAARSRAPSASPSTSAPRPRSSRGCATTRPPTMI